jgi:hypothetical protein
VLHRLQEPPWQFFDDTVKQARKQGRQLDAAMLGFAKVVKKLRYGR